MSAILARQWIELKPRHTAKEFARALGVSVRSGRRYAETPDLFPERRAVDLLRAIEREEQELDMRRQMRRLQREVAAGEIRALMGLDSPRLDLPPTRASGRRLGDDVGERGAALPAEGDTTPVASPVARRGGL